MRPKSEIYTPKRDDEHPYLFYIRVPPPPPPVVTVVFGIGIDCNNVHRIIHIGVPYTMEEYCQEVGRAGRDGLPAWADIYDNSYDISKARKNMT